MKELTADDGQGDAVQYTATLQMQKLRTDDEPGDAAHCATTLQRQELTAEVGHGDATQCIATLQTQEQLIADDVQATVLMLELGTDDGHGDATQCTTILQRQELTADDGQGDTAYFTPTVQRQQLTADDEQGDAVLCTSTVQRQQLNADDGQDDVAVCTTTLPRQNSISDGTQDDVDCCTTELQRQESDTARGKGNAAQPTTLDRRERCYHILVENTRRESQGNSSTECRTITPAILESWRNPHSFYTCVRTSYTNPIIPWCPTPKLEFHKSKIEYTLGVLYYMCINDRAAAILQCKFKERKTPTVSHFVDDQNHLRVHPKFLHSNATSHKWAFGGNNHWSKPYPNEMKRLVISNYGSIRVNNGATFVKIDKMKHSPDGDYSLVIEDDGGGMSPESLRHCMSFGFSQKCTTSSIGRYGNGFKTSTMRLGADAIVFTCTKDNRRLTRSVGLLSYTFLMSTGCDDIFVPAVDYEFDASSSTFKRIMNCGEKQFSSNLSTLLRWSPFSTEGELLNQIIVASHSQMQCYSFLIDILLSVITNEFSDMEGHGTKIIVFNLWLNDTLEMELDFMIDEQMHVANRLRYSLRVYASILHVPESFQIILCGRTVEPHCAINDLRFRECIKYRPQVEVTTEVDVITTIGYLKGAPQLDIYGFNVYHKNRLILVNF
ncbi:hypothetical protein PVAP13_4NG147600 [Panicum virgatum]|uniref:Morc S5 domain-containing protein n=1 Tax=Panicum virgatum TaxID=38727 RepID=A0A8T0T4E5_PANVG|nr:hypothetical protein PVAP13_4NG147600 [Panicum virgatum]